MDREAALRCRASIIGDLPLSLEEALHWQSIEGYQGFLLKEMSVPIGYIGLNAKANDRATAITYLGSQVADSQYTILIEFALKLSRAIGAKSLGVQLTSSEPNRSLALKNIGFELQEKWNRLSLKLDGSLPQAKPLSKPIQIDSLANFLAANPSKGLSTWMQAQSEILIDMLSRQREKFDRTAEFSSVKSMLQSWTEDSSFDTNNHLVALDKSNIVGFTHIEALRSISGAYFHGLTGVSAKYRGKGCARALKIAAISLATSLGGHQLITENLEGTPIEKMNFALGYQPDGSIEKYLKLLA